MRASIVVIALLLSTSAFGQYWEYKMTVTPIQPVAMHVPQKAPVTFTFYVGVDSGYRDTNWIVTGIPKWMKANITTGKTPNQLVLTLNSDALRVGWSYGATLQFTNLRNHNGDTARAFAILVQPEGWTGGVPLICGEATNEPNYCLDDQGGKLLTR
jgi:hypothetical protein